MNYQTLLLVSSDKNNANSPEVQENERKAAQLIYEAQTKLQTGQTSIFGSLYIHKSKLIEAGKCYQEAGDLYELNENWPQCASAFWEAATIHEKAGYDGGITASRNYVKAGYCFMKSAEPYTNRANSCLIKAKEMSADMPGH